MSDEINRPAHYTKNKIECIDYIKQQLGVNFKYHLEACVIKYLHRYRNKHEDPINDLKKAQWYLDRLIFDICMERRENEQINENKPNE
jgi:hypothetical protein|tara:strand:- start:828 stop:1091 length:264 start_codon:yes stop_codon:yes gene_type:complete